MTRHLVTCLAIVAVSFVSPTPAAAVTFAGSSAVYDTVDAVEAGRNSSGLPTITVTGIISGQSTSSELTYKLANDSSIFNGTGTIIDVAGRCDRLALLAMSKPGKFQLAMIAFGTFTCKLIVRTP